MPEYKVDYRGFVKRYNSEVWAIERHNARGSIRLIAVYNDRDDALAICNGLNAHANTEVG